MSDTIAYALLAVVYLLFALKNGKLDATSILYLAAAGAYIVIYKSHLNQHETFTGARGW